NGVIQARYIVHTASNWSPDQRVTPALLLELQRLAVNQIYRRAGCFRDGPVLLACADHTPPAHEDSPSLVDQLCDYLNGHWANSPAVMLSAHAMWRVNWIHPFFGGNGRSSRGVAYLVLCAKLGYPLPGEKTIPEFIAEDRIPYYAALREADSAYSKNV